MTLRRRPYREGAFSTLRPSRRPSKRSQDPVTSKVYETVMRRADGRCEVALEHTCSGRIVWHHRWPVEHGGLSTVENGLAACEYAHGWIHNHLVLSGAMGWLLREEDPGDVPALIRDLGQRLLAPDGSYREIA